MRIIIAPMLAFFIQLFLAAASVPLGFSGASVLVAPTLIVLVTTEFSLLESLASLLLLGFLMDCWIGATIGIIMFVMALLWLLCLAAITWIGKPDFLIRTAFILFFSLAFRVSVALALGIQGGSQGNWEWMPFLVLPFMDVLLGVMFYRTTMRILSLLGLCELRENTSQRLSRRPSRISLE